MLEDIAVFYAARNPLSHWLLQIISLLSITFREGSSELLFSEAVVQAIPHLEILLPAEKEAPRPFMNV